VIQELARQDRAALGRRVGREATAGVCRQLVLKGLARGCRAMGTPAQAEAEVPVGACPPRLLRLGLRSPLGLAG
jgi:hypothetical protein